MPTEPTRLHRRSAHLSLRDTYRLLRTFPLAAANDSELEQISEQLNQISSPEQIRALLARLPQPPR